MFYTDPLSNTLPYSARTDNKKIAKTGGPRRTRGMVPVGSFSIPWCYCERSAAIAWGIIARNPFSCHCEKVWPLLSLRARQSRTWQSLFH